MFGLPKTTAGALLRVELGRSRLAYFVIKATWDWITKILAMDDARLLKICLKRMLNLLQPASSKHNWLCNFLLIVKVTYLEIIPRLEKLDLSTWLPCREEFLCRYKNKMQQEEILLAMNAHYLQTPYLIDDTHVRCSGLSKRINLKVQKCLNS